MSIKHDSVNFIKHLIVIDEKLESDIRVTPFHRSLYYALFMIWNKAKFKNPIMIRRDEVKLKAKISSNNSYSKIIKELADFGYINYVPSNSWMVGSMVEMLIYDASTYITSDTTHVTSHNTSTHIKSDTSDITTHGLVVRPFINNIKQEKHLNTNSNELGYTQNGKDEKFVFKKEKNVSKKVETNTPKNLEEVETYFLEKEKPKSEANKFFNYYEANGWMVGKNKMKNWKAAANNWMLNAKKFQKDEITTYLHVNQDKDYSEPL